MAYRGMGQSMLPMHRGPSAVPVSMPVRRPVVTPPRPAASPTPYSIAPPAPSENPNLGPMKAGGPNPWETGQNYDYWVTAAYGAPGTASRNAVSMSCLMGGIGCGGFGDYDKTSNWSWMYNPPPYDFLDAPGVKAPAEFYAPAASMGLGGLGCGNAGGCGCGCKKKGIGQADGAGLFGTSLFQTTDFSQWGWGEYAALAAAAYFASSLFSDVKRTAKTVRRKTRRAFGS